MRGRVCWISLLLLAAPLLPAASARGQEAPDRDRAAFEQRLNEWTRGLDQQSAALLAGYRQKLAAQRDILRQQGDLDGVEAFDAEMARHDKAGGLPAPDAPLHPALRTLTSACRQGLDHAAMEHAKRVVQLSDQYALHLDQRLKQTVRDGQIDQALAIKAERDRVKGAPAYAAAATLVSNAVAALPAPVPPPAVVEPAPPAVEPVVPVGEPELFDAIRVYEGSPPAGLLSGPCVHRPLQASENGALSMTSGLGLALEGYFDDRAYQYCLRVRLRPKTTSGTFDNLRLLVQFFPGQRSAGRGAARETELFFAQVPRVGARTATCELRPVTMASFGGVIVSAFAPDGRLLAQIWSAPYLKDLGRTTFELPARYQEPTMDTLLERRRVLREALGLRPGAGPGRPRHPDRD